MPRVHLPIYDLDAIDELEEQDELGDRVRLNTADSRRDTRTSDGRGERRFGGAEALARKRADRRKNVTRGVRRA
ncbi:MAG TPA: hypothetical protein PLO33_06220 [Kouleothrix sp.]|uniref:hypothetical protein n=1 Tax=Kouleothrix sp. TaxID=2779161 RepID=UPI002C22AF00|nr:hypothetical protein [Kouleothrix sp.]